jgi:hypothetical protein
MIPLTDMIPISEIDSLIKELEEHHEYIVTGNDCVEYALFELKKLLRKPIPAISIEKIDENITHLEDHGIRIEYDDVDVIEMLEDLKK